MNRTIRSLVAATAATAALSFIPLASAGAATTSAAPATQITNNWAGYLAVAPKGTQIGSITAYWVLPKARPWNNSGKAPYQAAMWVGIDGDAKYGQSKPGLWQTGVYEIATKDLKIPEYVLFYEMVPGKIQFYTTDGQPFNGKNAVHVKPGDRITAQVEVDSSRYNWNGYFDLSVIVNDNTEYNKSLKPPAGSLVPRHTAEVITESPSWNGSSGPGLLDMGGVTYQYTDFSVTDPGKSWQAKPRQHTYTPVTQIKIEMYHGSKKPVIVTAGPGPSNPPSGDGKDRFTTLYAGLW